MTANELRIGNLVGYEKTTHVITELHQGKVLHRWQNGGDGYYSPYSDLDPIPLSPELLEAAGFDYMDSFTCLIDGFCFKRAAGGVGLIFHYDHHCNPKSRQATIKYLHQLQNLYHALTGAELPLSLPTLK